MKKFFNSFFSFIRTTDKLLLSLCLIASGFGIIMVHSATLSDIPDTQSISRDSIIMLVAISIGLIIGLVASSIGYETIMKLWPFYAALCLLLMISLFFFGVGPSNRPDARSWLNIAGVYFQPSELLKIGFMITFSLHLDSVKNRINEFKNIVLLCVHGAVPTMLVIATGDLGSALVFVAILFGMLYIAGVKIRYFAGGFAVLFAALPLLWIKFFSEFQKQRFLVIYFPNAVSESVYKTLIYQQQQSVNAIGSGQLSGSGLFKGVYTQGNLIPVDESDMIFSVIGEELGFIGSMAALLILTLIIIKIVHIGRKSNNMSGSYFCNSMALMIASQTIINVGMCLKLLPTIGIALPFFSAGGSSNLCIYLGIGIVLSVYRAGLETIPVNFRMSHIRTPFSNA